MPIIPDWASSKFISQCNSGYHVSRLYYEDLHTGQTKEPGERNMATRAKRDAKSYLDKVARLVPTEIVAGYLAMIGFLGSFENVSIRIWASLGIFSFCLVLTPLYFYALSEKGRPKIVHLAVSTAAFVIWAYATTGSIVSPQIYHPSVAGILLVAFSLISGLIPLRR